MAQRTVFISYASDTKPLAEELTQVLLKEGIHAWVDFKDLKPGQQWKAELENAIDAAQSFLILVGSESRGTPWQETEWRSMLTKAWTDSSKRLLPIVVGSSEPPPFLRNWVSLKIDPTAEPKTWTHRVVDALESIEPSTIDHLPAKSRREREERLAEMGRAIDALDGATDGDLNAESAR